jgi:cyclic pyranopterin phosphate synthase
MKDSFGREMTYLRVSVTDRCNLRCRYCMPAEGLTMLRHEDILSYEEIVDVVVAAVEFGFRKIRLTGGEPLVRRGVLGLVSMLASIDGVEDLAMTTNGTLLAGQAAALKAAGLRRVNVSLDAIDPARYEQITRGGSVADAIAGIDAAIAAGLAPVKINCVVARSPDEPAGDLGPEEFEPAGPDARAVAVFAADRGCQVRFIREMNLAGGQFSTIRGSKGGHCPSCDRLRLTSDGFIRPCLFSNLKFDVHKFGPRQAIRLAVAAKPQAGLTCDDRTMNRIGG